MRNKVTSKLQDEEIVDAAVIHFTMNVLKVTECCFTINCEAVVHLSDAHYHHKLAVTSS